MGFFNGVKKVFSPITEATKWMDVERVSEGGSLIKEVFKNAFIPKKAEIKETYAQALKRLNLTEQDIQQRQKEFTRLFYIFAATSILFFTYTFYLFFTASFIAGFIAFIISSISLVSMFRYHFWLFQIREKKLGCTLNEWFRKGLLKKKL